MKDTDGSKDTTVGWLLIVGEIEIDGWEVGRVMVGILEDDLEVVGAVEIVGRNETLVGLKLIVDIKLGLTV